MYVSHLRVSYDEPYILFNETNNKMVLHMPKNDCVILTEVSEFAYQPRAGIQMIVNELL